jgi:hypothetical protein
LPVIPGTKYVADQNGCSSIGLRIRPATDNSNWKLELRPESGEFENMDTKLQDARDVSARD